MKEFRLEVFGNLEDAMMWLEQTLYELELDHESLKGEVTYINNSWRCAVTIDNLQLELPLTPVISEYR